MLLPHLESPTTAGLRGFWELLGLEQHIVHLLQSLKASLRIMARGESVSGLIPDIQSLRRIIRLGSTVHAEKYISQNSFSDAVVQSKQKGKALYRKHFSVVKKEQSG
jgi:hypothetical protein